MFKRSSVAILLISLLSSLLVATPASGADTFSVTATSGTSTATIGGGFTTSTKSSPLAAGTYSQTITQTWPSGRAEVDSVNGPEGWGVQYKVNGTWVDQMPADTTTIEGVRTTGSTTSIGVSGSNQKLRVPGTASLIPGSPDTIPSSGRGDGWDVIVTPRYILNVYHHDSDFRLECHLKTTYGLCDTSAVYTVAGFRTSNVSSATYQSGKVYAFGVDSTNNTASVICTNVATLPFTDCGTVSLEPGVSDAQGQLSSQLKIGTKIYAADFANQKILCFDLSAATSCTEIAIPNLARANANSPGFTSLIGGRMYLSADKLYCVDVETNSECSGFPVSPFSGWSTMNVIPKANPLTGVHEGVCVIRSGISCFNFDGTSSTMPSGLESILNATATAVRGGEGYFETSAWIGTKVYWASNVDGSDWSNGNATCYDWATDALCAGFATNTSIGDSRYALRLDPYNSDCVWANGDNGALAAFTASTGVAGCVVAGISMIDFPATLGCSASGNVTDFTSLTISVPVGIALADVRVNLFSGDHEPIDGFQNLTPDSNGVINLASLDPVVATDDFTFEITAGNASDEQLTAVTGQLTYDAKPAELCVTLTSLASICPDVISNSAPVAQPGISFTSATSYQRSGSAAVSANQTSKIFTVAAVNVQACYKWSALNASEATGLYPTSSGDAGIVDFVWDSAGNAYVGGYFQNAGGLAAADNLAHWNGTVWEAVGGIDANTSAVPSRVAALALTSNGKLLVGGDFQNAGGVENADYFAIYDLATQTWSGAGGDPAISVFNNRVRAIAVDPATNKIFVGGNFNQKLLQIDGASGVVTNVGQSGDINNVVHFLSVAGDGKVTVGGAFSDVGEFEFDRVAIWDGTVWSPISENQPIDSQVWSVARSGTKTYVSGDWSGVKAYDSTSNSWATLGSGATGQNISARSLAVASNGDLYAATNNFTNNERWAKWNGTEWVSLLDGDTQSGNALNNSCDYDWCGAWKVKFDPAGNVWFGGDVTNIATKPEVDLFATWGLGVSYNGGGDNGGGDNGGGDGGSGDNGGTTTPVDDGVSDAVLEELDSPISYEDSGALPELEPLDIIVTEDGTPVPATVIPSDDGLVVSGDGFSISLAALANSGAKLTLDDQGRLVLETGGLAKFNGSGFMAETPVSLWIFSEPTLLGQISTTVAGAFDGEETLPMSLSAGNHTLQLNGVTKDGTVRSMSLGVVVSEPKTQPVEKTETKPIAGSDFGWAFWLGGIVALAAFFFWFILAKRRNDEEEEKAKK